ncbi:MAG: hypothetical protein ABFS39_05105 [Pseudomonadota bacterium]
MKKLLIILVLLGMVEIAKGDEMMTPEEYKVFYEESQSAQLTEEERAERKEYDGLSREEWERQAEINAKRAMQRHAERKYFRDCHSYPKSKARQFYENFGTTPEQRELRGIRDELKYMRKGCN